MVGAASEPDTVLTNGMSEFSRDKANNALVVSIGTDDFESSHPWQELSFRKWEKLASGVVEDYSAPIQRWETL